MADVKGLRAGSWFVPLTAAPSFTNHLLDANNDGIGAVMQAREAVAITHIGFRYGSRTGTPPVYVATLEGFSDTTGLPDGADVGGGSPTAKTFTPPADTTWDGTWQWIALTNAYTPARGQRLCPTIRYSSGTVDGSNNGSFTLHLSGATSSAMMQFPDARRLQAGTWARMVQQSVMALRTASIRYGHAMSGFYNTRSASTAGHRQALKFTLPAGSGDTFKIKGVRFAGSPAGATTGKTSILFLADASGIIQNITLDVDWVAQASTSYLTYEVFFDEASLTALSFGTVYYLGLEVVDAINGGVIINGIQLDNASDLDAYPGGADWHFATFDGSTWTADQTVRPFVEPIFDDITKGTGPRARVLLGI